MTILIRIERERDCLFYERPSCLAVYIGCQINLSTLVFQGNKFLPGYPDIPRYTVRLDLLSLIPKREKVIGAELLTHR